MARPAMRDPAGKWSLSQIATAAGITYRTARTLVSLDYLDPDSLGSRDIVRARIAAALLDAPRPAGLNRNEATAATAVRNQRALELTAQVSDSNEEATLVVLPGEVHLAPKSMTVIRYIDEFSGQPMLLLPVGAWAVEATRAIAHGVAS